MSTEIVKHQPSQVPSFNFFDADQFAVMQRVCTMFSSSELVPDMYKVSENNPKEKAIANCMIAIEIAQRIGASPLMVMQNMVPIYGKPSWSSKFLIATVNTCGRFNPLQYRFKNLGKLGKVEYTDYEWQNVQGKNKKVAVTKVIDLSEVDNIECVAFTTAKGSNELLESSPVSLDLAIKEGWYTKAGSKWRTMAKQMLMYRAASFWTSAYAPELSMGMRTVEENEDYIEFEEVKADPVVAAKDEIKANGNKTSIGIKTDAPAEPPAVPAEKSEPKPENADGAAPSANGQQKAPF